MWIRNSYAKGLSSRFPPRTINWFWNESPEAKPTFLLASKWPKQRLRNGLLFQQSTTIILRPRFLNSSIYHFDILEQVACLDLLSDSNPYNSYQYQNFTTEAFNYRWKFGGIPSVKMYRFQILFFIKRKYTSQNQKWILLCDAGTWPIPFCSFGKKWISFQVRPFFRCGIVYFKIRRITSPKTLVIESV